MAEIETMKLIQISVCGVVQGVGFRPFVYRLANKYNLRGWVRNTSGNVEIEVEGEEKSLNKFITGLKAEAPPMASIASVLVLVSWVYCFTASTGTMRYPS